jgi:hypothetical protein
MEYVKFLRILVCGSQNIMSFKCTFVVCNLFNTQTLIIAIYIYVYTGCHRRKGQYFGSVFLMLNYTEKTQNTYIQSDFCIDNARVIYTKNYCY